MRQQYCHLLMTAMDIQYLTSWRTDSKVWGIFLFGYYISFFQINPHDSPLSIHSPPPPKITKACPVLIAQYSLKFTKLLSWNLMIQSIDFVSKLCQNSPVSISDLKFFSGSGSLSLAIKGKGREMRMRGGECKEGEGKKCCPPPNWKPWISMSASRC